MKTNKKQRRIIAWAVVAFLLATFFPPWRTTFKDHAGHTTSSRVEFSAILSAPDHQLEYSHSESLIAGDVLLLEWVCILVVAGAACYFLSADAVPVPGALPPAPLPPNSPKKWKVFDSLNILLVYSLIITVVVILQARIRRQTIVQSEKDVHLQQAREQQWQAAIDSEMAKRQQAENIVQQMKEQQRQKADSSAQQKTERIEQERAKWKSLSIGMTQQQVVNILGKPDSVDSDGYTNGQITYTYNHFGNGYVIFLGRGDSGRSVSSWSAPSYFPQ